MHLPVDDPLELAIHAPWRLERRPAAQWFAERPELHSPIIGIAQSAPYFDGKAYCNAPGHAGVYFLLGESAELLYIGKATQLDQRLWRHFLDRRIPFRRVQWLACPIDGAEVLEAYLIGEMKPPANRKYHGHMQSQHDNVAAAIAALNTTTV